MYGQVSTGQEQEFDYGIKNNSTQTVTTPTYLGTVGADGTYGKILLADLQGKKAFLSTGLIKNGLISANGDPTKFNITAGIGIISNFDDPENPTSTIINFPAFTGITPTYLLTGTITYVAINNAAAVVMQATPFTPEQRRSLIVLGAVVHSNLTIINVINNISAPSNASTNQLHDFIEAVGALNLTGNKYTANGANLQLNKSAGLIFKLGSNFANDWKNPHELSQTAGTSLTFRYRTQNGTEGSDRINLDPALYDLSNVLTAVPNNKFTIQTVTMFQSGVTRIQYGQTVYDDLATAKNAVFTRNFVLEPNSKENGIIRAYIIMKNTTTSLQNISDADILEAQKFGGVASGGVALTLANIVSALGYTPENVANKQNSLAVDGTGVKYPTVDAINGGIIQKNYIPSTLTNWQKKISTDAGNAKMILLGDSTSDQAGNFFPAVQGIEVLTAKGRPLDGLLMSNVPNFGSNGNTIANLWNDKAQVKGLDAVIAQNPDLVVFCYGINDIRTNTLTKDQLKAYIIDCINYLKASLPNCDFVLRMPNSFVAGLNQGYIIQGGYATQSLAAQGQTDILYNAYKELDKYWDDVVLFNTQDKIYGRVCPTTTILMTDEIHPEYLSMLNELVKIIGINSDFKKERAKAATAINYSAPYNIYKKSLDLDINYIKIFDGNLLGQGSTFVDASIPSENMNKYEIIKGDIVSIGDETVFSSTGGAPISAGQLRIVANTTVPSNTATFGASVKVYRHRYNHTQAQEIYFMDKVSYPYIHRVSISVLNDTQLIVNQIIDDDVITGKVAGLIPDNLQLSPTDILLVEGQSPLTLTGVSISPFQPTNAILSISTGGFNSLGSPTYAYIVGSHGYEGMRSNSPAFTGNPTAPTPTLGDNDTSVATTAYVTSKVASLGNWTSTGNDIANTNTGNVGIGTVTPPTGNARLVIKGIGNTNTTKNLEGRNSDNTIVYSIDDQGSFSNPSGITQSREFSASRGYTVTDGMGLYNSIFPYAGYILYKTTFWESDLKFKYASDLSASYDDRTLVDKGFNDKNRMKSFTVATLPASPTQGDSYAVTDALAPTYLVTVVGGGTVYAPVVWNGTNWVSH